MSLAIADSVISTKDLDEAKVLFSGPTESDYYRTDEMLLSATGSLKPVFFAPSVASVITKDEIKAMGATTLDEILETVPGLHISKSSLSTFSSIWTIRGIRTDLNPHVLFLINGVPIVEPFKATRPESFHYPVSMISRVEIVRGPGSALYGAEAFAGTINIITKDGQEIDGTQSGTRIGSFGQKDDWIQHGGVYDGWNTSLGFEYQKSDGDDKRIIETNVPPKAMNTKFEVFNAHAGLMKNEWAFNFWGWKQNDAGAGPGIMDQLLTDKDSINMEAYLADAKYESTKLLNNWTSSLKYRYLYQKSNPIVGIAKDPLFTEGKIGNPQKREHEHTVEIGGIYTGSAVLKTRVAVGYKHIKGNYIEYSNFQHRDKTSTATITLDVDNLYQTTDNNLIFSPPTISRKIFFASLQEEWAIRRNLELTAGIRYDNYSDFGDTINPRAALVWQTRYDLVTKLLYGRAFRAPSFAELYAQNKDFPLGNLGLSPEVINTVELAFDYRLTIDLRTNVNFYYYKVNDLIEPAGTYYENNRDLTGRGVEGEVDLRLTKNLRLQGNAAWLHNEDDKTGLVIPNTPRAQAYGSVSWKFMPDWAMNAQGFWIGYRARDTQSDSRKPVDDYYIANITLQKNNIFDHIDLTLAIKNVFNTDVREPSTAAIPKDYPMQSRSAWVEVLAKF